MSIGPSHHLWFCTFKTATLASELQVSKDPSPHLWFLHAKQRIFDQKYKSLWVSASSVVYACKTAPLGPELQVSIGSRLRLLICAFKTATLALELLVSMDPRRCLLVFECKTAYLNPE